MPRHEIVVSAENNHYLVWQAMLFHSSCVTHLGQPPVVMVHKGNEPLLPGFERIRATGGIVQTAPNYRAVNGIDYPPRNTAGSLRHVETDADYIVLCDPDMIFLQRFPFEELSIGKHQISFDYVGYLNPDAAVYQPTLDNVCLLAGIAPERLRQPVVDGGVPHVVPTAQQKALSNEWFDLMELFPVITHAPRNDPGTNCPNAAYQQQDWLTTMWSIVMAMHRLKLEPVMTKLCVTNCHENHPLPELDVLGPKLLHYCYGGPGFDKRSFDQPSDADERVWHVPDGDSSMAGAIRKQLVAARRFYGFA